MPTLRELYAMMNEAEASEKTASTKQAIDSPQRGAGDTAGEVGAVLEDVMGDNMQETKVRIKKKLEEMSGAQSAADGLMANVQQEGLNSSQAPQVADKMPPTDAPATQPTEAAAVTPPAGGPMAPGAAAAAPKAASEEEEAEKVAEVQKLAEEYYTAGRFMARGFKDELDSMAQESQEG